MKGYKFLTSEMKSKNGNETPWEIGVWKEWEDELKMCHRGFHACKEPLDSLKYIYGDRWFEIEADEKIIEDKDKFVASKMRIIKELPLKEIMVKFTIACAKNCLFGFEQKYLNDDRPRKAIESAEKWLENNNDINAHAAHAAAHAAADAAHAAHTAHAAYAAYVAYAAAHTAYAHAVDAAAHAADAAVDAATAHAAVDADAAEKKWQNKKLKQIINSYVDYQI